MFITQALAATPAAGEAAAPEGAFPPFDPTTFTSSLFWLVIVFGALYLLMSRVALPRVAGILETRRGRIAGDLDSAAAMQKQADDAAAAYEKALSDAKAQAQTTAQQTRDRLAAQSEAERKSLEAGLNAKLAAAEAQIAATKAQAMSSVGGMATDTAAEIIKHITGVSAEQGEVAKAVAAVKIG
ncbi:F0F1 ATP synthase subunit B [Roseiarcaceae bacterium H3SJ34-1]|uniref:F0F1 ATP synthase subunit B n=1 Tax=Terripilifer ovatus TaxID=3032367 RepID=UPI003AB93C38|nr:F0F1 ATP synthase subunit B [Roseiarcaceae bacterium H3SJ34-1]